MLGGEYTDTEVPDSETAFDDRKLDIADDGTFEWRVTPDKPSQLLIREVYNDWSAQRGTVTVERTDTVGTAPPALTRAIIEKRYATAGKQLVNRVKTWLQFPQWFYLNIPVNTMVAPRLTLTSALNDSGNIGVYCAASGENHYGAAFVGTRSYTITSPGDCFIYSWRGTRRSVHG